MKSYTIQNEQMILEMTQQERHLAVTLRHREGNAQTVSMPLLVLEIRNRMEERIERIETYRVMQIQKNDQELHVTVRDIFRGITVGLWLHMDDRGDLAILMPPAEIEEAHQSLYRLNAAELLPGLMSAGTEGEMLLPINTGVRCRPTGKPKLQDRFLIYGEQERWELLPTLPVCAAQTPQGGFVAIATQGACDMYCQVQTDGKGHGCVGLFPMFRRQWIDPVDWTQREIRISPLLPCEDMVVTTAKRLRHHIINDLGKPTLAQRAQESPECAYQQTAYTMKLFHGIQQQGIMMFGKESKENELLFKTTLTFPQAQVCFDKLKKAGLDRIYFQSTGWNPKGHDGAYPTDFPIDRRLGGEKEFVAMIEKAKALGFHITTHSNLNGAYFLSPDFHKDWTVHDIWGEPKVIGCWGGGMKANHWGLAVPEDFLRSRLEKLKKLGFNGMQYLDGVGTPLYVNYHPLHRGGRSKHAAGINRYLDLSKELFGAIGTEMGFLYCALHADAMCSAGGQWHLDLCKPHWPVTALLEERVPLWQLAMHGLVTLENLGMDWPQTMQCILFGEVPRDEWCAMPGVFPVLDDARIAKLKARYDLCCDQFGYLITQELTDWKRLDDGVEQTCFADGTEVIADLNQQRLTVNQKPVLCPILFEKDAVGKSSPNRTLLDE